jgi:hypothetical protein
LFHAPAERWDDKFGYESIMQFMPIREFMFDMHELADYGSTEQRDHHRNIVLKRNLPLGANRQYSITIHAAG